MSWNPPKLQVKSIKIHSNSKKKTKKQTKKKTNTEGKKERKSRQTNKQKTNRNSSPRISNLNCIPQ